jgi:hypothetical protein
MGRWELRKGYKKYYQEGVHPRHPHHPIQIVPFIQD